MLYDGENVFWSEDIMSRLSLNMDEKSKIYEKMIFRLNRESMQANRILICYSIMLIVYSLTDLVFKEAVNSRVLSYANILISVVMLAFSLQNKHANYQKRIEKIYYVKKQVDSMKIAPEAHLSDSDFEKKYIEIISDVELETEEDKLRAIRGLKSDKIRDFFLDYFGHIILLLIPLIVLLLSVNWQVMIHIILDF